MFTLKDATGFTNESELEDFVAVLVRQVVAWCQLWQEIILYFRRPVSDDLGFFMCTLRAICVSTVDTCTGWWFMKGCLPFFCVTVTSDPEVNVFSPQSRVVDAMRKALFVFSWMFSLSVPPTTPSKQHDISHNRVTSGLVSFSFVPQHDDQG